MRPKRKQTSYKFKSIELDSKGEVDFCHYLEELERAGYVLSWDRAESLSITDGLKHDWTEIKQLKTKTKEVSGAQTLLEPSVYTPDFVVTFTNRANGILLTSLNSSRKIVTPFVGNPHEPILIECKPSLTFDPNNMLRLFRVNQKFVYYRHKKYVNLVVTENLFKDTFTPKDVIIPIARKTKKAKWSRTSLSTFENRWKSSQL